MTITTLLIWIIVGAIAGWLASMVMRTNRRQGLVEDIIVGILGGFIGGFLLNALNIGGAVTGINVASILTAFIGAVVLLALLRCCAGPRPTSVISSPFRGPSRQHSEAGPFLVIDDKSCLAFL